MLLILRLAMKFYLLRQPLNNRYDKKRPAAGPVFHKETLNLKSNIMKKLGVIFFMALMTISGCTKTKTMKYSFLNGTQLKQLGIVVTDQGVFYKNHLPGSPEMKERFSYLGFYCTNDIYLNSILYKENDTLPSANKYDSLFISLPTSDFDFYPMLIGNTKGEYSLNRNVNNEKLFPVAICMVETNLPKRTDTLVIWFKPSSSLQAALPGDIKVEDYLMIPPVNY
jgi:hypothetical protein